MHPSKRHAAYDFMPTTSSPSYAFNLSKALEISGHYRLSVLCSIKELAQFTFVLKIHNLDFDVSKTQDYILLESCRCTMVSEHRLWIPLSFA